MAARPTRGLAGASLLLLWVQQVAGQDIPLPEFGNPPPPVQAVTAPYQYVLNNVTYTLVAITNGQRSYGVAATPADPYADTSDPAVGEYVKKVYGNFTRLRYECGYKYAGVLGYIELAGNWTWASGGSLTASTGPFWRLEANTFWDPVLPGWKGKGQYNWNNFYNSRHYANFGVAGFLEVAGNASFGRYMFACNPQSSAYGTNDTTWAPSSVPMDIGFVRLWLGVSQQATLPAATDYKQYVNAGVTYSLVAITNGESVYYSPGATPVDPWADTSDAAVGEYVKPKYGIFTRLRYECGYKLAGVLGYIELSGVWTWATGGYLTPLGTIAKVEGNAYWDPKLPGWAGHSTVSWNNYYSSGHFPTFGASGFTQVDGVPASFYVFSCNPQSNTYGTDNTRWTPSTFSGDVGYVRLWLGARAPVSWTPVSYQYLRDFAAGDSTVYSLASAQARCVDLGNVCNGVTCNMSTTNAAGDYTSCTVRASASLTTSTFEITFLKNSTTTTTTQTTTSSTRTSSSTITTSFTTSTSSATSLASTTTTSSGASTSSLGTSTSSSTRWWSTTITTTSTTTTSSSSTSTSSSTSWPSGSTTSSSSSTSTTVSTTSTTAQVSLPSMDCGEHPSFQDERGLLCKDWVGQNCSAADGYTNAGLQAVQSSCRVSCGYCEAPTPLVFKQLKKVQASMSLQGVDLSTVPQQDLNETLRTALAAALGVSPANMVNVGVQVIGRRLLRDAPRYSVKYEVLVLEKQSLRDIIVQATSLSTGGSTALQTFSQTLSQTAGVDVSSMVVTVPERPRVDTVQCALTEDGDVLAVAPTPAGGAGAPAPGPAASSGGAIALPECADDGTFIDEQGEGCNSWVGLDCRASRWLKTERPYTSRGLREVLTRCPLACGVCSPLLRKTPKELVETCADDAYLTAFCLRWRGLNCSEAPQLGYSTSYVQVLLRSCPLTCGLCPAVFTCADAANFTDEQHRPCNWWAGRDCTRPAQGYTRKGILDVQAACPLSCRFCSTGGTATGSSNSQSVTRGLASADPSDCTDNSSFSILSTFTCSDFIGKSCTYASLFLEPRWLLGPRAVWAWHTKLWDSCPVSCGRCDPSRRPSPHSLLLECEDDPAFATWCTYYWSGQVCAEWQSSLNLAIAGDAGRFNQTLFERCPSTCGLCDKPSCRQATYRNKVVHACLACVPGTYAAAARSGPNATQCRLARPGFAVPEAGSAEETPCMPGNYTGLRGEATCHKCAPGRYSEVSAVSECSACLVGWFQPDEGTTACKRCPQGTFADVMGANACEECPQSFSTPLEASTGSQECTCPAGTYRSPPPSGGCETCPEGIDCPGGHSFTNSSEDRSPQLMPGMMSLPEDPFSVYTCAGEEDVCQGKRPLPYSEEDLGIVCPEGRGGERCWGCPAGFYHSEADCLDCKDGSALWPTLFFVGQLLATFSAYRSQASGVPPSAAYLTFFTLTDFLQVMYRLKDMQINWPPVVVTTLDFLKWFDYLGFLDGIEFHQECYFGPSIMARVVRDVSLPLLPLLNFGVIGLIACLARKRLKMPVVLSTVAAIYSGLFVNLSALALQLLPSDRMPNGKHFPKAFPGVQVGSAIWIQAMPFTIAATAVYCIGFLAIAVRGTLAAPRLSEDEDWAETFDFLLGDHRPDVFWWGLVDLGYQFSVAMIQALFDNIYLNLYFTMVLVVSVLMIEIYAWPSVYDEVNRSSAALKTGLLVFLTFGTAFIDSTGVDLSSYSVSFGGVMLGIFLAMSAFTACGIVTAAIEKLRGGSTRANVDEALRLRIATQRLAWMPDHEFILRLDKENFLDADRDTWVAAGRAVVSTFFGQQPTHRFFGRRAHRSVKYSFFDAVWANREADERQALITALQAQVANTMVTLSRALQASQAPGGLIHAHFRHLEESRKHFAGKRLLHMLRSVRRPDEGHDHASLRDAGHVHAPAQAGINLLERSGMRACRRLAQSAKEVAVLGGFAMVTEDLFVDELRDIAGLGDADLRSIFRHLDMRQEGEVTASRVAQMLSLANTYYGLCETADAPPELDADAPDDDTPDSEGNTWSTVPRPSSPKRALGGQIHGVVFTEHQGGIHEM